MSVERWPRAADFLSHLRRLRGPSWHGDPLWEGAAWGQGGIERFRAWMADPMLMAYAVEALAELLTEWPTSESTCASGGPTSKGEGT